MHDSAGNFSLSVSGAFLLLCESLLTNTFITLRSICFRTLADCANFLWRNFRQAGYSMLLTYVESNKKQRLMFSESSVTQCQEIFDVRPKTCMNQSHSPFNHLFYKSIRSSQKWEETIVCVFIWWHRIPEDLQEQTTIPEIFQWGSIQNIRTQFVSVHVIHNTLEQSLVRWGICVAHTHGGIVTTGHSINNGDTVMHMNWNRQYAFQLYYDDSFSINLNACIQGIVDSQPLKGISHLFLTRQQRTSVKFQPFFRGILLPRNITHVRRQHH